MQKTLSSPIFGLLAALAGLLTSACSHLEAENNTVTGESVEVENFISGIPEVSTTPIPVEITIRPAAEPSVVDEKPTPVVIHDAWQRLRSNFELPEYVDPRIDDAVIWFLESDDVLQQSSKRAAPFLYYILERLAEKNLPSELALVPLLESGYRTHARSQFGAVGLWQFMPATGRQYGLRQTRWRDDRRDFVAATDAGLKYLETLYRQFDYDWLLAVAAYNCGPGTLKKVRRSSGKDFWAIIEHLPKETQLYVPKLLAAKAIISNPAAHAIELYAIDNAPFFERIAVNGPINFTALNQMEGWNKKIFKRLNGGFRSNYFEPNTPVSIRVPVGSGAQTLDFVAEMEPPNLPESWNYLVQRGDTLGRIATEFNVSIADLKTHNGIIGHLIHPGQKLQIRSSETAANRIASSNPGTLRHIVKPGESLWTVGRQYGVSARRIATNNDHPINKTLYPGKLLLIPIKSHSPAESGRFDYIVVRGDSLWSIAKKFGIALTEIKKLNSLLDNNKLKPGQKLLVSGP